MKSERRSKGKSFLALLLALVMVLGLMPAMSLTVSAADAETLEITSGAHTLSGIYIVNESASIKGATEDLQIQSSPRSQSNW